MAASQRMFRQFPQRIPIRLERIFLQPRKSSLAEQRAFQNGCHRQRRASLKRLFQRGQQLVRGGSPLQQQKHHAAAT
jgi:hypothetical protein